MERSVRLSGIALFLFFLVVSYASAGIVAFPGAEGFGATAIGGSGGKVFKVTNTGPD
jgi:succinate dehydrogenase/fumarate reductase cytochrome b subunit